MSDANNVERGVALVRVLAAVLTHLVDSNDGVPENAGDVTKFHALRAPSISINDYLERIRKYASCSAECFVLALVYIDRLIQRNSITLTSLNVHRVLITAVMLAAKFFDDQYFNNAYYARVGGIPTTEINSLELEFLFSINFSLHVAGEEFNQYFAELVNYVPTMVSGPDVDSVHSLLSAAPRADEPPSIEAVEATPIVQASDPIPRAGTPMNDEDEEEDEGEDEAAEAAGEGQGRGGGSSRMATGAVQAGRYGPAGGEHPSWAPPQPVVVGVGEGSPGRHGVR